MREAIQQLCVDLEQQTVREEQHLIAIGGPTGMRNSQASALGLARNDIRREVISRLIQILEKT